jgi:hypothetical protein
LAPVIISLTEFVEEKAAVQFLAQDIALVP